VRTIHLFGGGAECKFMRMTFLRFAFTSALVATLMAPSGCGGSTAADEQPAPASAPPDTTDGGREPLAAPVVPDAAPPDAPVVAPPLPYSDSNTLRLDISVDVDSWGGCAAMVGVAVHDAATNAVVRDAVVMAGPVGRPSVLNLVDSVYMVSPVYMGEVFCYQPDWEFSVERGPDHVRHLGLRGPSFPNVDVTRNGDFVVVDWSPADEAGVMTSVCVKGTTSPADLAVESSCDGPADDGRAVIAPPPLPNTWVAIDKFKELPVGSTGGTAVFRLHLDHGTPPDAH